MLEFFTIIIRNGSIFQLEDSFDRGKIGPDNIHYKYVEFYGHVNDPFDLIIIYHCCDSRW